MDSFFKECGIRASTISSHAPRSEVAMCLNQAPIDNLERLRSKLFIGTKELNLTDEIDILVMRKNTVTNPLRKKLTEDIIVLERCMKDRNLVPIEFYSETERKVVSSLRTLAFLCHPPPHPDPPPRNQRKTPSS